MRNFTLVLLVVAAGCVGEITDVGQDPVMDPGGGGGGGGGGGAMPDAPTAPQFACRNKATNGIGDGEHNAGQDCMSNCHNHGFTMGGTLLTAANQPYVGGVITAIDANGKTIDVISQQNGNFYTKQSIAFPVKVYASACPDVKPMITTVNAADAGCNRGGCHVAGATGPVKL